MLVQNEEELVNGVLYQQTNMVLANINDIDAFIGLLAVAYPKGRHSHYSEILSIMRDASTDVSLRGDKVEVLISGRWQGAKVFAAGTADSKRTDCKWETDFAKCQHSTMRITEL